MRIMSEQEQYLLSTGNYINHIRVFIKNLAGEWIDLSNLEGQSWVIGYTSSEDIDMLVKSAEIRLKREDNLISLAMLMERSKLNVNPTTNEYEPLLDVGKEIKVDVAMTPPGAEAPEADSSLWHPKFHGEVDVVSFGDSIITLQCRDLGARLQDRYIKEEREYGSTDGIAVESQMQKIIDDELGVGNVYLRVPASPGWFVKQWRQQKEPILNALDMLAKQIGWDVRYGWYEPYGTYELMFTEPPLNKVTVDWTFGPDFYADITELSIDRSTIRNFIRGLYTTQNGDRITVEVKDETSISKYGERFMEVAEAATSQIDTAVEMDKMLNSMLTALSAPKATHVVTMPFVYSVELHDRYTFLANNVHYDNDQTFNVISIDENFDSSETGDFEATMTLTLRGTPAGAYMEWLKREARPGIAPPPRLRGLDPPQGLVVTGDIAKGLTVLIPEPSIERDKWRQTTVRVKDGPAGNIVKTASGRLTQFPVTGLELAPGTSCVVDANYEDISGNKSSWSVEVPATVGGIDGSEVSVAFAIRDENGNILFSVDRPTGDGYFKGKVTAEMFILPVRSSPLPG